jgi:hypothetical protein
MLRTLAVGLSLFGTIQGSFAGPPAAQSSALPKRVSRANYQVEVQPVALTVVQPAAPVVRQEPAPVVVHHSPPGTVVHAAPPRPVAKPCDCERVVRPGRIWLVPDRPIVIDCKDRYEPRIRDIRFSPMSSTLPGSGLGAPDTLFVLPPYRDGYIRLFETR